MQFCFNVMAIVFKATSKNCFAGDLWNFLEKISRKNVNHAKVLLNNVR